MICVCVCVCAHAHMSTQSLSCVQLSVTLWKVSPVSSVHGIFQARILELVAVSYSRMIGINLNVILVKIFISIILSFIIFSVNVSHRFWFHYYSNARNTWRLHRKTKLPSDIHHEQIRNKQKNPSKSNPSIYKNNNTSKASGVILSFKSWEQGLFSSHGIHHAIGFLLLSWKMKTHRFRHWKQHKHNPEIVGKKSDMVLS